MANFDTQIQDLIKQQQGFITSLNPTQPTGGAAMSPEFMAALNQMLATGGKVDTSAIGKAATSEGNQLFNTRSADINQAAVAGGGTQSSAQTAALARALSDISTNVGNETLRAGVASGESAQERILGALGIGVGAKNAETSGRQADTQSFMAKLAGLTGQSGANQDLLSALLGHNTGAPGAGQPGNAYVPGFSTAKPNPIADSSAGYGGILNMMKSMKPIMPSKPISSFYNAGSYGGGMSGQYAANSAYQTDLGIWGNSKEAYQQKDLAYQQQMMQVLGMLAGKK